MMNSFKFYGAHRIFGIDDKAALLPISWSHGIAWGESNQKILFSKQDSLATLHLVANEYEYQMCPFHGNVIRVGLPIIYHTNAFRHKSTIDRLYVPRHQISGEYFQEEITQLLERANKYGSSAVLLPGKTFDKFFKGGESFIHEDLLFLKGANSADLSSLSRIASILKSTKKIYTDCLGSHIYYGALFGCTIEVDTDAISFMRRSEIQSCVKKYPKSYRSAMQDYFLDQTSKLKQLNEFNSSTKKAQYDISSRLCGLEYLNLEITDHMKFNPIATATYKIKLAVEKVLAKCL